ncbi:MAG: hypothetical protein ACWGQW_04285 [bacterium]
MKLDQAVEYLRSFEADGQCRIVGIDTFGEKIVIADCSLEFLPIVGTYVEITFGVRVVNSGPVLA